MAGGLGREGGGVGTGAYEILYGITATFILLL